MHANQVELNLHQAAPDCCLSNGRVSTTRLFAHDMTESVSKKTQTLRMFRIPTSIDGKVHNIDGQNS